MEIKNNYSKDQILHLIRKHGTASIDAILDPKTTLFCDESIEGFIGYRQIKKSLIVFGDPIAKPQDHQDLAKRFKHYLDMNNLHAVFVGCSRDFSSLAMNSICKGRIEFGKEVIFTPSCNPKDMCGPQASLVRRKVKQAQKEGVEIVELKSLCEKKQMEMESLANDWVKRRKGLQMHISNIYLFENCYGKRWFYASYQGKIVAAITINKLENKQGYLMNHLITDASAPKGTSELLITSVLEILNQEQCEFVTVGVVSSQRFGEIQGFSFIFKKIAHFVYECVRKLVHIDGLEVFWNKFLPASKEPSYLLFTKDSVSIKEIFHLLSALKQKK